MEHWELVVKVRSNPRSCVSGASCGVSAQEPALFLPCSHLSPRPGCSGASLGHLSVPRKSSMSATFSGLFAWRSARKCLRGLKISFIGHFPCVISYFLYLCFLTFFLDQLSWWIVRFVNYTPSHTQKDKT